MRKLSTREMTLSAIFAAMVAVLELVSIHLPNFKFTLSSFPIFIGALLFGPLPGILIGGVGTFISQLVSFGLMPTTIIWMAPYIVAGGLTGLYAKKKGFHYESRDLRIYLILMELIITAINTLSLYIDGHVYGYYTPALITKLLLPRIIVAIIKGFVFGLIFPPLLRAIQKKLR